MDGVTTSSHKPSSGLRHAQSLENIPRSPSPRKKYWPTVDQAALPIQRIVKQQGFVVLDVDENCPVHGLRSKCTCSSFVSDDENGMSNDGMGSSDSLNRSGYFGHQYLEHNGSNDNLVSSSIQPFNNNPSLPSTQRDIIGNNLQFNSPSQNNDWIDHENDELAALLLYRDALKKKLTTSGKLNGGLPKMRQGRVGSQWRHIKQTNTYSGSNLMYIDGAVRVDDSLKYPIPRFGYPPLKRPQHNFSSSYNNLSFSSSNPATQSMETLTWSGADRLGRRPSVSQHSNGSQRHVKENLSHWPANTTFDKPRYKPTSPGTYETWFRLNNAASLH